ncbi:Efflux pump himE [Paramyrothecium foliicola]|nr:Efflux pump himE [Paramyrothecium foliicola]
MQLHSTNIAPQPAIVRTIMDYDLPPLRMSTLRRNATTDPSPLTGSLSPWAPSVHRPYQSVGSIVPSFSGRSVRPVHFCPVDGGFYSYIPNVAGNAVCAGAFGILMPLLVFQGLRSRTLNFTTSLVVGIVLEILGFVARILLRQNRQDKLFFTLSLLGTLIGPAFMSAAIFVIMPHILRVYGDRLSPVKPMIAGVILSSLVIGAVILQVVGIVAAGYGFRGLKVDKGVNIIAAGLGLHTVALIAFVATHLCFILRVRPQRGRLDPKYSRVYQSPRFSRFLRALEIATGLLLVISMYRITEMASGISSKLFQNEEAFMIMNGAVPFMSCALLSIFHPGATFGDAWAATSARRPRRRAPAPAPLRQPASYVAHHRYDPSIGKQYTPTSQKPLRYSDPPKVAAGSPGLPPNPKPLPKPPSPRAPPAAALTPPFEQRFLDQIDGRPQVPRKNMVDSEALW